MSKCSVTEWRGRQNRSFILWDSSSVPNSGFVCFQWSWKLVSVCIRIGNTSQYWSSSVYPQPREKSGITGASVHWIEVIVSERLPSCVCNTRRSQMCCVDAQNSVGLLSVPFFVCCVSNLKTCCNIFYSAPQHRIIQGLTWTSALTRKSCRFKKSSRQINGDALPGSSNRMNMSSERLQSARWCTENVKWFCRRCVVELSEQQI